MAVYLSSQLMLQDTDQVFEKSQKTGIYACITVKMEKEFTMKKCLYTILMMSFALISANAQRERIKEPTYKETVEIEIFDLLEKARSFNNKKVLTTGVISTFSSSGTYIYVRDERRPKGMLSVQFKKDQKVKILDLMEGQSIVIKGVFSGDSTLSNAVLMPSNTKIKAAAVEIIETSITQLEEDYRTPLRAAEKYKGKHIKLKAKVYNVYASSNSGSIQIGLRDESGTTTYCNFPSKFRQELIDIAKNDYVEVIAYCASSSLSLTGIAISIIDRFADVEPTKVLMSRLWSEYKKNPIETSEKYNNQPIIVKGKLNRITTSSDGSISANLYDRGHFSCSFSKKEAADLKGISSRRSVYVIGIVSPHSNKDYIYLESCRLQKK